MSGLTPPVPDRADTEHAYAKAAVAAVPVVGGSLAELFNLVVKPSFEKRHQEWMRRIAIAIDELDRRGIDLDSLQADDEWVSAVLGATRAALGTHLEEKLDLLASCLVSAALPDAPDHLVTTRLLRLVEDFGPQHFLVLLYLRDPGAWYDGHGIERPSVVGRTRRELLLGAGLELDAGEMEIVLDDLQERHLASLQELDLTPGKEFIWDGLLQPMGALLLDFVSEMNTPHQG